MKNVHTLGVMYNWQHLNTERMHIFHSDDDLILDRKRLEPIFKQLFTLSFIF